MLRIFKYLKKIIEIGDCNKQFRSANNNVKCENHNKQFDDS